MLMRVAIRGFVNREKKLEDLIEVDVDEAGGRTAVLSEAADKHMALMVSFGRPFMMEIEFLDEPDPLTRFFRFGTDPQMMTRPIAVDTEADHFEERFNDVVRERWGRPIE